MRGVVPPFGGIAPGVILRNARLCALYGIALAFWGVALGGSSDSAWGLPPEDGLLFPPMSLIESVESPLAPPLGAAPERPIHFGHWSDFGLVDPPPADTPPASDHESVKTATSSAKTAISSAEPEFEMIPPGAVTNRSGLGRGESVWGRFPVGSWCRTRTVGTTFPYGKPIRSVVETKSTLTEIREDGYLLKHEVTIKMGVRNHLKEPEYVKYRFFDLPVADTTNEIELPAENIEVMRKIVPCQVRAFERTTPAGKERTVIWFTPVQFPYIFQQETEQVSLGESGRETLVRRSKTEILRGMFNLRIAGELATWISQTVEQKNDSVATTKAWHSMRIPGGVLRQTILETDASGKPLYQSTTVLLDYSIPGY